MNQFPALRANISKSNMQRLRQNSLSVESKVSGVPAEEHGWCRETETQNPLTAHERRWGIEEAAN